MDMNTVFCFVLYLLKYFSLKLTGSNNDPYSHIDIDVYKHILPLEGNYK